MMKKVYRLTKVILGLYLLFATPINKWRFGYGWGEAFGRTVMAPMTGTLWAKDFSERKFSSVHLGMTRPEVVQLLGKPLREGCGDSGCTWLYSWQDTGTADFDRRWVGFDLKGHVDRIYHDFFVD
jgi:hypothetical protein